MASAGALHPSKPSQNGTKLVEFAVVGKIRLLSVENSSSVADGTKGSSSVEENPPNQRCRIKFLE